MHGDILNLLDLTSYTSCYKLCVALECSYFIYFSCVLLDYMSFLLFLPGGLMGNRKFS
jgi:hypothetical protein